MNRQSYPQKTRWWFIKLLKGWSELPSWWARYGNSWKDVAHSLLEFIIILLSPLLSVTAPFLAMIQHIKETK